MEQGYPWSTDAWRVNGESTSQVLATSPPFQPPSGPFPTTPPTYTPFTFEVWPALQIWYIQSPGFWQYCNATGCWTLQGGVVYSIAGFSYGQEVAGYATNVDVTTNQCVTAYFGPAFDVTSCGCNLASELLFVNVTDPSCKKYTNLYNKSPIKEGIVFGEWHFSQKFSVNVSPPPSAPYYYETIAVAGNYFAQAATLNPVSPSPNPVPTSGPIYDYCWFNTAYDQTMCNLVSPPAPSMSSK